MTAATAATAASGAACGAPIVGNVVGGEIAPALDRVVVARRNDVDGPTIDNRATRIEGGRPDIAASEGTLTGSVHVGALPLARTHVLPMAVASLLARHQELHASTDELPG